MNAPRRNPYRPPVILAGLIALGLLGAACGSTTPSASPASTTSPPATTAPATAAAPAAKTTAATAGLELEGTDQGVNLPSTLAGGIVPVSLVNHGSGVLHLVFYRLHDGVSFDQIEAASDADQDKLASIAAGNGALSTGQSARLVFNLTPGDYEVVNVSKGTTSKPKRLVVTAPASPQPEPTTQGEIVLKGMAFTMPPGFTGKGTYKLTNADTVDHEGSVMRLNPGVKATDLTTYFGAGRRQGPPPGDAFGGFGALGPGTHGWMTLDLAPGSYALVCHIPGSDGMSHVGMGMVSTFSL